MGKNINHHIKDLNSGSHSLFYWSRLTPTSIAVRYAEQYYSYEKMAIQVAQFIKSLEGFGVKRGSLVGIQCDQIYLQLILNLAIEAIGATHTVISKTLEENTNAVLDACSFLLLQDLTVPNPLIQNIIWITDSWISEVGLVKICAEDLDRLNYKISPDDVVMLSGTSGTTGAPKFFEDSRGALSASISLFEKLFFNTHAKTNFITVYPMTVGASYAGALAALKNGSTIVMTVINQFDEEMFQYPFSHSVLTVRDAYFLQRYYANKAMKGRLGSLRILGAALPLPLREWLEEQISNVIFNAYSSTEAGLIAEIRKDGFGILFPNAHVQVVDSNKNPVPVGTVGVLMVKSDQMIEGYLWDEELTKKHFSDGWFLTSDSGYVTDTSNLVILGRNDDMLNLGGVKVSPYPMENRIKIVDGILDCVLLNPKGGSVGEVYVCIEKKDFALEQEIINLTLSILNYDKDLISFFFLERFSRTRTGKVKRIELLSDITEGNLLPFKF